MAKRTGKNKVLPDNDRPKQNTYKPEYCQKLIDSGIKGDSLAQFCSSIQKPIKTFETWCLANPDLQAAKLMYQTHAKAYWDGMLNKHIIERPEGKKLNSAHFKWLQQDRFKPIVYFRDVKDLMKCSEDVLLAVSRGQLHSDDAVKFSKIIADVASIQQHAEMWKAIEELKELAAKNQSERFGDIEGSLQAGASN